MLFNSLTFLLLLVIVFLCYWIIQKHEYQNILLLISSYVFYGWWDWRFLFLIIGCSAINYFSGKAIYSSPNNIKRKIYLALCCFVCVGSLCYFKYANFL